MGLALLIPLSLAMACCGLAAFIWALRTGQYDDLDGAAWRILLETQPEKAEEEYDGELAAESQDCNTDRGV